MACPTGICVELNELAAPDREGFRFAVLGGHDADLSTLVEQVTAVADQDVSRQHLQRSPRDGTWQMTGSDVAGRIVSAATDPFGPVDVVIDGHTMSWDELGRALNSYEGWQFRPTIVDHIIDARDDAQVLPFPITESPDS